MDSGPALDQYGKKAVKSRHLSGRQRAESGQIATFKLYFMSYYCKISVIIGNQKAAEYD